MSFQFQTGGKEKKRKRRIDGETDNEKKLYHLHLQQLTQYNNNNSINTNSITSTIIVEYIFADRPNNNS